MRRALSTRIFSALVASWLAFVLAEPAALHICPAHDFSAWSALDGAAGGAGASNGGHAGTGHGAHAGAGHGTHAGDARAGDAHTSAARSGSADAASSDDAGTAPPAHQCACVGHCAGTSPAGVPAVASAGAAAILLVRAEAPHADFRFAPPAAEFLLPFANGPPALPV